MKAKFFINTNIFVYSFDARQPEKMERASELIQHALNSGMGIVSTQVIQGFLNVATQKFSVLMKV